MDTCATKPFCSCLSCRAAVHDFPRGRHANYPMTPRTEKRRATEQHLRHRLTGIIPTHRKETP